MNKKPGKGQSQTFDTLINDEISALETLKARFVEPSVLAPPRLQGAYTLDTDAWDKQIGCVVLQKKPDGTAKPIGHWSRSLNDTESAYNTMHRECRAVVWGNVIDPTILGDFPVYRLH